MLYLEPEPRLHRLRHGPSQWTPRRYYVMGTPTANRYQLEHALRDDEYVYIGSSLAISAGYILTIAAFCTIAALLVACAAIVTVSGGPVILCIAALAFLALAGWLAKHAWPRVKATYLEIRAKFAFHRPMAIIDTGENIDWQHLRKACGATQRRKIVLEFERQMLQKSDLGWQLKPCVDEYLLTAETLHKTLDRDGVTKEQKAMLNLRLQNITDVTARRLRDTIAAYEQPAMDTARRDADNRKATRAGEEAKEAFIRQETERIASFDVEAALDSSASFIDKYQDPLQ